MIGHNEIRPRNPLIVLLWTFGLYLLVFMNQYVYFWLGSLITGASFGAIAGSEVETPTTLFLRGGTGIALGVPLLLLAVRFLWRRPWSWLCLRFHPGYLAGGAALGVVAAFAAIGVLAALGLARITAWPSRFAPFDLGAVLAGYVCWALFISILEETVFRGMATREFALRWGWLAAAIGGGLYFAAIHLISVARLLTPSLVVGILVAGVAASGLFVALYVRSRSLWLPIGFHAGWNFALSAILGATMSGKPRGFGLFKVELSGPTVLTGGDFGVEMSVISVVLMLAAAAIVLRFRRGGAAKLLPSR
jgi:membrane protease YdiL (CAAX protease family)